MHTGPNIERDGLVFGYDTGYGVADNSISTRFYPGEPTINYGENSMSVYAPYWTSLGREGNTHTIYRHAGASSSTIAMAPSIFSGLPAGTITTISGYLYKNGVPYNTTSNTISTYNTAISHETRDDGYFRYTQSLNSTSGAWNIHAVLISSPVEGDTIILKDLQMEVNTHSTPYLKYNTSRSSTASLIDLTKTTNIDVSNVSFDSTGQPTFDGTSDYIDLPSNSDGLVDNGSYTLSAWLRPNGSSWGSNAIPLYNTYNNGTGNFGIWHHFGHDNILRWRHRGSSYTTGDLSGIGLVADTWQLTTITWDGTTLRLYKNGVETNSTTAPSNFSRSTGSPRIGGLAMRSSGALYLWNGDIASHQVYNKALSATEIKQNFRAYKNRFDI